MALLKVATCQYPVGADIDANLAYVKRQMAQAASRGRWGGPFPRRSPYQGMPASTSSPSTGTAGTSYEAAVGEVAQHLAGLPRDLGRRGSAHRLSGTREPHNSAYVIDDDGPMSSTVMTNGFVPGSRRDHWRPRPLQPR